VDGKQGWWVVFGAFWTLAITAGIGFYVIPVVLAPIMAETGWTLTEVSLGVTAWGLSAAVLSPLLGALIDRLGARWMMLFGCLVGFGTTWLLARVATLTQLYVVLALAPIGAVSCTYIPVATVVARWFYRLRGIATGVAMLGLGLGGAVVPQIADWLLDTYTWRETYDWLALGYLAAMLPTLWWVRNPPPELEQAYTSQLPKDVADDNDLPLAAALRTRSFWGLSLGDMVTGAIFSIFNFHLILYLTADLGSQDTATNVFSLFMLLLAGGTMVFGPMADVVPLKRVILLCYFLPVLGVGLLFPVSSAGLAFGFAVIAGLAGGGRSAVFPMGLAYSFGEKHMAAIWGVSNSMFMLGNGLGPPLAGVIYDETHSTRNVYALCIAGLLISTLLVALIRPERPAELATAEAAAQTVG
jgi:MFS family permease